VLQTNTPPITKLHVCIAEADAPQRCKKCDEQADRRTRHLWLRCAVEYAEREKSTLYGRILSVTQHRSPLPVGLRLTKPNRPNCSQMATQKDLTTTNAN